MVLGETFSGISRREVTVGLLAFVLGCLLMLFFDVELSPNNTGPVVVPTGHAIDPGLHQPQSERTGGTSSGTKFVPLNHDALEKQVPDLRNKAIVTMATNDETGQLALTLFQSLRDGSTKVPRLILILARGGTGSQDCQSSEWKRNNKRESVRCDGTDTISATLSL
jgi:hypothetical protein